MQRAFLLPKFGATHVIGTLFYQSALAQLVILANFSK